MSCRGGVGHGKFKLENFWQIPHISIKINYIHNYVNSYLILSQLNLTKGPLYDVIW